jgi:hypothetical protein
MPQRVPHAATDNIYRQMLAIGHLLKKPMIDDIEVQQFDTTIKTDQKKLKALLTQRLLQA